MGSRVTGLSNYYLFQRSLSLRNIEMSRAAEQLSSEKRINRPSDDPTGSVQVLAMRQSIAKLEQYDRNLNAANQALIQTESTLSSVNEEVILKARDIAIKANAPQNKSPESRAALAAEVQQLQQHLLTLSNTQINGKYLFAGYKTDTTPFTLDAAQPNADPVETYAGDTNVQSIQISDSSTLVIQSRGDQLFQGDGTANTVNLFQSLANLEAAIRSGDYSTTSATGVPQMLEDLNKGSQQIINEITSIGAKTNRLDTAKIQLAGQRTTLSSFISDIEDADMAEVATNFSRANTALQATLQSAGAILNLPSLINFIGR
ncbi:MAG: flagellar hook-associated protein FlgL [Deltaproteobacteria bacterium]|nr:flagellar hook-associated protein FlgL [Deltaproteobacteria bacterium]